MTYLESLKRTGRTTRMLQEALQLAEQGRAVYVVAVSHPHAAQLQHAIDEAAGRTNHGIKIETAQALGFSWAQLRVPGSHANCVFLIDHAAIEWTFSRVLAELHRFDQPTQEAT